MWPSTVGPKPNERRSKEPRNFANDHRGLGQWTGVWKFESAHVPGPKCVGETHVKCQLVHKAEPLPMCAS